jgi:hypothetical protein
MKANFSSGNVSLLILLVLAATACAATAALAADEKPPEGNTFEPGFEERVRTENWDDLSDFSDASDDLRHQMRYRTRIWSRFDFGPKVELMLMLNNESKKVYTPDAPFRWDETIIENLYLEVGRGGRWSAKIGRENLMRGDGFVLFDGNALDGSRTAYFNALDVTRALGKSKIELIAISDPSHDTYLPVFNDKNKPLTEWDEQALGVYYTGKDIPRTGIEAYYFYKTEADDIRAVTNPARQPDRRVETLGGRVVRELGQGWSATGELAVQWGSQDPDASIRAWGGTALVRKKFEAVAAKPSLSLAWIGLSGDDPATGDIEGWDPIFSRWPKWSELYLYTLAGEKGVAYWTNLGMWQAEALASPSKPLSLRATYYKMSAFQAFSGSSAKFGTGRDRGDLFEFRADVAAGPHFKGHILYEHLAPGDYYAGADPAWFFRVEVMYTFKRTFAL